MQKILLKSKLTIPSEKPIILNRDKSLAVLNDATAYKTVFICAPSGYGKSTLVAQWARERKTAWLSLDQNDRYLQSFFHYLIAALQSVVPGFGKDWSDLIPQLDQIELKSFLTLLANETEKAQEEYILVLDDYHLASTAELDKALATFIEHKSDKLTLILISRKIPEVPWESWQGKKRLNRLGADDLRLSIEEAGIYFKSFSGLKLSKNDLTLLWEKTEGWFAGFHLAALACKDKPEQLSHHISRFKGTDWNIVQYLSQEVMKNLKEDRRRELSILSLPESLNPSLGAALLDKSEEETSDLLLHMENEGFFIQALNQERSEFQFHALFREALLSSFDKYKEMIEQTHQKAVQWYLQHDQPFSALTHLQAIGDWDTMASCLQNSWSSSIANNLSALWSSWVKCLPSTILEKDPLLHGRYAFLLLGEGKRDEAESRLCKISQSQKEPLEPLNGTLQIGLAYLSQLKGDQEECRRITEQMLSKKEGKDPFHLLQAESLLGLTYLHQGEPTKALRIYTSLLERIIVTTDFLNIFGIGFNLAEILIRMGELTQAEIICNKIISQATSHGKEQYPGVEDIHRVLADIYREKGDINRAALELKTAEFLGENSLIIGWNHRISKSRGRLEECKGDFNNSRQNYIQAKSSRNQSPLPDFPSLEALLKRGEYLSNLYVEVSLPDTKERYEPKTIPLSQIPETLNRLIPFILKPDCPDEILHRLKQLEKILEETENRLCWIETGLWLSLALVQKGHIKEAAERLNPILRLAVQEGIRQVFLDHRNLFLRVFYQSSLPNRLNPANKKFLFELIPPVILPGNELSRREQEVLQLISQGYSNSQIADALYVALDTVKGHNKRIFDKLQVKNRTEAVRKAKDISIL